MARKIYLVLALVVSILNGYSQQEVCETPDDNLLDANTITKCTIEPKKNSKRKENQIRVKVSARKRFLKKRRTVKRKLVQSLKPSEAIGVKDVVETDNKVQPINIVNENKQEVEIKSSKSDIDILKEKLSKEEVAKASKLYYVDKIPEFKNCEKVKKRDRLECFNVEMVKHINKHFKYPSEAIRNQIQGEVWVRFIIDKNGFVRNIKTLGPDNGEILNEEAKRVVFKLPNFKPAKNNGKTVSVKYGFPINFSLEE